MWGVVLVGVVGFLGSEVVLSPVVPLSPIVSGCLPSCGGWVLVGVVGFLGSEVVLSPVVSRCLPLSPVVSLHVGVGGWLVWSASWALKWSCLPLSPIVSGWRVLVAVVGFLGSEVVLSPVVSGCLPSCGGWVLVGVAAILGSEVFFFSVVSGCLPSCGGWVLVGVVGFLGSEVVLSPVVSCCLPSCGGRGWLVWPHLEQKHSEIKITGFNLNLLSVNCLGSTLV